jgi:hypothetical protein
MPSHPVPLPARTDIATVAAECDLSLEVVERLYEHLRKLDGEPPAREDLREYVAYGAEHLGEGGLRLALFMPADPDHPATPAALRLLEEKAAEAEAWRKRPRAWMAGGFWVAYLDACKRATPPITPRSVAPHFDTLHGKRGVHPDHLRRLIRRFGVLAKVDGRIKVVYP